MKTLNTIKDLTPLHQDSLLWNLMELVEKINYIHNEVLSHRDELEEWEAKEYDGVLSDHYATLEGTRDHIRDNESVFNEMLSTYGLTVTTFINKFAPYDKY